MRIFTSLFISFAAIGLLLYCLMVGLDKQAEIDDLYAWRQDPATGRAYRNIDLQASGG